MRLDRQIFIDLQSNPYGVLDKLSTKEIVQMIKMANTMYHTEGKPLISDEAYEIVKDYLRKLEPDHPILQSDFVGAVPIRRKVTLPVWMGSMDKIKDDPRALDNFKSTFKNNYVVSDKLDGISALFIMRHHGATTRTHLYSRGNGNVGQDISHLLKYVANIPSQLQADIMVRGELILSKKAWGKVKGERTNPRNTVAGLANSPKADERIAKLVDFVAYDQIEPRLKQSAALSNLKQLGFQTVEHKVVTASFINVNQLSEYLIERRKSADYEIDGIVITHDANHDNPTAGNPDYAFAFKSILTAEEAEVSVKEIVWNVSKNGLLKPVAHFDAVHIGGAHIQRVTAVNGRMVYQHKLGPGSRIVVIRSGDVIPFIKQVLSASSAGTPSMPDSIAFPWKWNANKVEVELIEPKMANDYHIKQLENYVNVFNIKGLGPKHVRSLYHSGIDTVRKLINITKLELYKATHSSKITMKVFNQIQKVAETGSCVEFMVASNVFGAGMGRRKLIAITEAFPGILTQNLPTFAELVETKGVGERFARQILEHLQDFYEFMDATGIPCRSTLVKIEPTPPGLMSLQGKSVVFTGFRSKALEEFVNTRGGKVGSSISHNTHILVAKNANDNNIKMEAALEFGTTVMSLQEFSEEIGWVEPLENKDKQEDDIRELEELVMELDAEPNNAQGDDADAEEGLTKTAECVRHATNWSNMKRNHIFGKSAFDADLVANDLPKASPKLDVLIKNIARLDAHDMKTQNKTFKHMIYSDVTKRGFGAKIIAAGLTASGFKHVYDKDFKLHKASQQNAGKMFAILAATQIYYKPMTQDFKRTLLSAFNKRPDNVQGNNIRIIVLDSGYREGIDLFDVKYVHMYEPILNYSDEMQAIGRAIRYCGQKGLEFEPETGWTLHVYKYEHSLTPELTARLNAQTSLELLQKEMNINTHMVTLGMDMEKLCHMASVDNVLTHNIHKHMHASTGGAGNPIVPAKRLANKTLTDFVKTHYASMKWPKVEMENLCKDTPNKQLLEFSPSQEFIRSYFQPDNPYKGIFLWHSLGSGKTCTAIGAASMSWEAEGYTILWVTRGTLRSDVYKNMFDMSCVERIRDMVKAGKPIPTLLPQRKKLLAKTWLPPISYKQFNNALNKQNRLYDYLVRKNGFADPLRRTLIIIDEAHLIMSPSIKERERPDINLLKAWIRHSYKVSNKDSVRIMLMSATPISDSPMNFIKLLNLTDENDVEDDMEAFTKKYLDPRTLKFTPAGKTKFKSAVTGRISYLNRLKDVRQFAQPKVHSVVVPISEPEDFSGLIQEVQDLQDVVASLKSVKIGDTKAQLVAQLDEKFKPEYEKCEEEADAKVKKACVTAVKKTYKQEVEQATEQARATVAEAKEKLAEFLDTLKERKRTLKEKKKNDVSISAILNKHCYPLPKHENQQAQAQAQAQDQQQAQD